MSSLDSLLTEDQRVARRGYRAFADEAIAPWAQQADIDEKLPRDLLANLAAQGWIGARLPSGTGGWSADPVRYGLLSEELGRTCSDARNLVAVQDMVLEVVHRWGTGEQHGRWVSAITAGDAVAAFALTEPEVGSDAAAVTTEAVDRPGGGYVLRGRKKWISFAQIADVLLVLARYRGAPTTFLMERNTPGVSVRPQRGLLGLRGSMLGEIDLDDCALPPEAMLGAPGSGLVFVASVALDIGRFSTAWGSTGLAQACLEEAAREAQGRSQGGRPIGEHQLVQQMLTEMLAAVDGARLLCLEAATASERGDPDAVNRTLLAKYAASIAATRSSANAVQIHGARGVGGESPVERFYRDAKVQEVIEGTTQLMEGILGRWAVSGNARPVTEVPPSSGVRQEHT